VLGFIPGVGAMYNGQFAKAIAHVVIFAVLASLSDHVGVFGILVAAWVFYQVFDAYQTAMARRDGLPLPNPFGLNDIGQRLGIHPHPGMPGVPPVPPVQPAPGQGWQPVAGSPSPGSPYQAPGAAGFVPSAGAAYTGQPHPGQPYTGQPYPGQPYPGQPYPGQPYAGQPGYTPGAPYPPMPPYAPGMHMAGRDIPTGAIILIGLGILFLFGSLGLLHHDWIAHGWPLLIIGLGIWIIFRRTQGVPPMPPPDPSMHGAGHSHSVPTHPTPTDTTGGPR
jgi:hypothetical protein